MGEEQRLRSIHEQGPIRPNDRRTRHEPNMVNADPFGNRAERRKAAKNGLHGHVCGCIWKEVTEDPDAVDGTGQGWTKVSGCEDHPMEDR